MESRTITRAASTGGFVVVGWNARDDRGREVTSGVYFVRVDVPGETISRRVVHIR